MTDAYSAALEIFNSHMHTAYTLDNPQLIPVTRRTAVKEKNRVIREIGAKNKPVSSPSDFNYMLAKAIIGMDGDHTSDQAAILFSTDMHPVETPQEILLHELAHVFALTHEADGAWFADSLDEENIPLFSGYLIWKEFIADYIALWCVKPPVHDLKRMELKKRDKLRLLRNDSTSHDFLANYLAFCCCSYEVQYGTLEGVDLPFVGVIRVLARQVRKEEYWKIEPEFLEEIGNQFLYGKTMLALGMLGK